jgi:hypothetical protein
VKGYERGWDEMNEMKERHCGINLVIEHRVGHAPEERQRIGVILDALVFKPAFYLK